MSEFEDEELLKQLNVIRTEEHSDIIREIIEVFEKHALTGIEAIAILEHLKFLVQYATMKVDEHAKKKK